MNTFSKIILLLFFLSSFSAIIARYLNITFGNYFAKIVAFCTFILAVYRPKHFPDLDSYEIIFDIASVGDFNNQAYWILHGEPGFKIIIYLLHICGFDFFHGFLLFFSLLSFFFLIYLSKISKIPFAYIWYTYFSIYFITRDLGVIRLSIASHLIVLMFLRRKFMEKLLLLVIASVFFQYFAIIAICANFLSKIKLNIFYIIVLLIISFALSKYINFGNLAFIMPEKQMGEYESTDQDQTAYSISAIIRNLIFALFVFLLFKKESKYPIFNSWIWSAFLSVFIYILTANILVVSQRFSAYFGAIIPLAFSYKMIKINSSNRTFILLFVLCLLNFINAFYYNNFIWTIY
jgi:hypothetical protein